MAKGKLKNPHEFMSSFNERKFQPYIRAIGQSTLLWNDLHEWFSFLYGKAIGGGLLNPHQEVWQSLKVDRAKRDILLAAAKTNYVDVPVRPTPLQKRSYEAIKWLYDETNKLEDDRNNITHAPLWTSRISGEVLPASAFGNRRAISLDDKYLLPEYERIRDSAHLLRNYAAAIHDPMSDPRLAWPDRPKLPDRRGTKRRPPPMRPRLYVKPWNPP